MSPSQVTSWTLPMGRSLPCWSIPYRTPSHSRDIDRAKPGLWWSRFGVAVKSLYRSCSPQRSIDRWRSAIVRWSSVPGLKTGSAQTRREPWTFFARGKPGHASPARVVRDGYVIFSIRVGVEPLPMSTCPLSDAYPHHRLLPSLGGRASLVGIEPVHGTGADDVDAPGRRRRVPLTILSRPASSSPGPRPCPCSACPPRAL